MKYVRYENSNISDNSRSLIEAINDENCNKVILFASPTSITPSYDPNLDGADNNLPLVVAVALYRDSNQDEICKIYDGCFLTAARRPRYLEVKSLLDAAENSNKVYYSNDRVDFTASLNADEAGKVLLRNNCQELTNDSRSYYFSLISNVPEADYP